MYVRPGRLAQGVFLSALDNLYIQEESVMEKKYDFQKAEKALEKMWQENEIYRYQNGKERKIFSIDTPPPTVSGKLHIGHVFSYTQAEMIARFKRMQGYDVFYPFGFDDNGLPTTLTHEKGGYFDLGPMDLGENARRDMVLTLEDMGFEVVRIGVDSKGVINVDELVDAVDDNTIIVSVMYVNNEIGSVMPVQDIAKRIKEKNPAVLFHVDAIQAFGKYVIYPGRMGIDMMSVSSHKFHGPKGVGALYIRDRVKVKPVIYGGGQQNGMRSGTENVPGIAGMALAAEMTYRDLDEKVRHMREVKQHLIDELTGIEEVYSNSGDAPHIASITFKGVRSEVMLHALEERGIYVSSGSACSSNKHSTSGTLKAIGLPPEKLESTLRFSFSPENTIEQVDYAVQCCKELLPVLRRYVRKK